IADGAWLASANYLGTLIGAVTATVVRMRLPPALRGGLLTIALATLAMGLAQSRAGVGRAAVHRGACDRLGIATRLGLGARACVAGSAAALECDPLRRVWRRDRGHGRGLHRADARPCDLVAGVAWCGRGVARRHRGGLAALR